MLFRSIRHDPGAFLAAAVRHAARVFIIVGHSESDEARQFSGSGVVYALGTVLSVTALGLFVIGLLICWSRRQMPWPMVLPPAYVSATIAPFLTEARYTITVQPFMYALIAVTLVAAYDLGRRALTRR